MSAVTALFDDGPSPIPQWVSDAVAADFTVGTENSRFLPNPLDRKCAITRVAQAGTGGEAKQGGERPRRCYLCRKV